MATPTDKAGSTLIDKGKRDAAKNQRLPGVASVDRAQREGEGRERAERERERGINSTVNIKQHGIKISAVACRVRWLVNGQNTFTKCSSHAHTQAHRQTGTRTCRVTQADTHTHPHTCTKRICASESRVWGGRKRR